MARFLYIVILACMARSQTIDESVLTEIFGTPPPEGIPSSTTQRLEDIMVKPTEGNEVYTDPNGASCKCVPYYLCNNDLEGTYINNASVTGWGELDIRFGEDNPCQESVERCCTSPKSEPLVEATPQPTFRRGCGFRNPKGVDFTIRGGSGAEAQFGEFPWVVMITTKQNEYQGVGALIHPSVVLTGAHIIKHPANALRIRAGEWDTQTSKERLKHQQRNIDDIVMHEDFRDKTLFNDVALLRLESPVELAEHINVICLPEYGENFDSGRNCVANGWGKDVFGSPGRYAVILKRVDMNMMPSSLCNTLLKQTRLGKRFQLHHSFVCAGGEEGKDTCQGDGGAPLACPTGNDQYKLTGLVAWGIGCGQRHVPAVYVNVPLFRFWIDDKMTKWGYNVNDF